MGELVFPITAVLGTVFVVIPALSLLSAAALRLHRGRATSWSRFGSETTFAWLVAPTLLPLGWLVSSALHQVEPGGGASCALDHAISTSCVDAVVLLVTLLVGVGVTVGARLWRERDRGTSLELVVADDPLTARVREATASLSLRGARLVVVRGSSVAIHTRGLLRPTIVVDACFARTADDEVLVAAVLHEVAHVRGRDALRGFVARACMAVNPAARLLRPELERWRSAREAGCDEEAVSSGGRALALAAGIVQAAKFRCAELPAHCVGLCGHDAAALRLRLSLLLAEPSPPARTHGGRVLAALIAGVVVAPHMAGPGLLERFHFAVERLLGPLL